MVQKRGSIVPETERRMCLNSSKRKCHLVELPAAAATAAEGYLIRRKTGVGTEMGRRKTGPTTVQAMKTMGNSGTRHKQVHAPKMNKCGKIYL